MKAHDTNTYEFLKCKECDAPARPNVLMFGDDTWIENQNEKIRYSKWITAVSQALQRDPTKRLAILEIGCGTRVPSVRMHCEHLLQMLLRKTLHTYDDLDEFQVDLIRVNPVMERDVYQWKSERCPSPIIKIRDFGLASLLAIDDELQLMENASCMETRGGHEDHSAFQN